MKSWKLPLCSMLVIALSAALLIGCGNQNSTEETTSEETAFSYSNGLDDNGYWKDIVALDYVSLPDYASIEIPSDTSTITDEAIQGKIDSILSNYTINSEITDRAVADGDTVNIDYVGSIDGVEFEGGNTNGAGTDVTIGVTAFIDDFLQQLIGHTPGEAFDIEVTFPDDYQTTELAGKDAVFAITINHISESVNPELTDEFVSQNLTANYGWTTVEEMKEGIAADLKEEAVDSYVQEYIANESSVSSVPDQILEHQNEAMVHYYEESATGYGMTFEDFLTNMGMDSVEALIESQAESNKEAASRYLVLQAIAEDMKLIPTDDDVKNYFIEYMNTDDYSSYQEKFGMPYLKQITLGQMVLDQLAENASVD